VTYQEIAEYVVKKTGSKSQIRVLESEGLINSMPTSSEKIRKVLGWKPWITKSQAINPRKILKFRRG
jgi:nucleoside-diphosphate-sugar epimerase